ANYEVERLLRPDDAEIVALCRIPSGIPTIGVVSAHASGPLCAALLACGVRQLDEHLQIEKILELWSSRIDAFEENDVLGIGADVVGQPMPARPIKAPVLSSRPLA